MGINRTRLILAQGDPGLFDVLKRAGRGAVGFLTGGPVGAIAGVTAPIGPARAGLPSFPPPGSIARPGGGTVPILNVPGVRGVLERAFPGGSTGLQAARSIAIPALTAGAPMSGCPQGYHPNKTSYMTQAGFVAKGSKCVRNRRRNLSNGRANTRALRRLAAWDKQERKRAKTLRQIARK